MQVFSLLIMRVIHYAVAIVLVTFNVIPKVTSLSCDCYTTIVDIDEAGREISVQGPPKCDTPKCCDSGELIWDECLCCRVCAKVVGKC